METKDCLDSRVRLDTAESPATADPRDLTEDPDSLDCLDDQASLAPSRPQSRARTDCLESRACLATLDLAENKDPMEILEGWV